MVNMAKARKNGAINAVVLLCGHLIVSLSGAIGDENVSLINIAYPGLGPVTLLLFETWWSYGVQKDV